MITTEGTLHDQGTAQAADDAVPASRIDTLGVLVIDNQPVFRRGLHTLLTDAGEAMVLVGEAAEGTEGLRLALRYEPAVILLTVSAAGPTGVQLIRDLKRQLHSASIIVLTDVADEEALFYAITYGAAAYLVKTVPAQELLTTIYRVAQGEYLINNNVLATPVLAARVLTSFRDLATVTTEEQPLFQPLSAREVEVLDWIAKGNSNKEVARALAISDQTVKNHVTSIMRKLAANDRTHAVVYALRQGWITA